MKPVKIVVGLTAGGGIDTVSRILAQKLGASTGQSFIVDNRVGAGGNIAFEFVAKSEPDGYTLLNTDLVLGMESCDDVGAVTERLGAK